jgi:hypothetical protein
MIESQKPLETTNRPALFLNGKWIKMEVKVRFTLPPATEPPTTTKVERHETHHALDIRPAVTGHPDAGLDLGH